MAILGTWLHSVLAVLLILSCVLLILVVLVQRGRGGGLAGAFGGVGGHSILGSRTGDFLTWVTISFAALFVMLSIVLDRLTPPKAEKQAPADTVAAEPVPATLSAEPQTLAHGQDVLLTYRPSSEQEGQIERVEFFLDTDGNGEGDQKAVDEHNYDNMADPGWTLEVNTGHWPQGTLTVAARAKRKDGTPFPFWVLTKVTITQPPASQPAESRPAAETTEPPGTTETGPATEAPTEAGPGAESQPAPAATPPAPTPEG
jgi:protein translocase SecG subunit